jgi:hypothetical protein
MSVQQPALPAPAPLPAVPPPLPPLPEAAPAQPGIAATPTPSFLAGVPRTAQELSALRARREELSNQLVSATGRRNELARRLRQAQGADRAGIEQRLQFLDRRILQLESDIATTGQQVTAAPTGAWTGRGNPFDPMRGQRAERGIAAVGSLFTLLVFAPVAFAFARLLWRRANNPPPQARDPETAQRLARLESAVDTIAEEVERMGEGQRFLTRLLSESHAPAEQFAGEPVTREISLDRR